MTPERFIENLASELDHMKHTYCETPAGTAVGKLIESLQLDASQVEVAHEAIRLAVTESFYTLVCALEGNASLGTTQEPYTLTDEQGNRLSGELDALFYERILASE